MRTRRRAGTGRDVLVKFSDHILVSTYRSVDRLVSIEIGVLSETVVRLTEGNARNAASDQASIDRGEAGPEGREPALGVIAGARLDVLTGPGKNFVETVLPVIDVLVVDGAAMAGLLLLGHCDEDSG